MSEQRVKTLRAAGKTRAQTRVPRVLMADDSRNEHLLMLMAAEEASAPMEFHFVDDGSSLLGHLLAAASVDELPDMIVLDLRMPILDGHSTLMSLQSHPTLWQIPVVVFTTSTSPTDVQRSLDLGASFVRVKPSGFLPMVDFVRELHALCTSNTRAPSSVVGLEELTDSSDEDFRPMSELSSEWDDIRKS